MTVPQRQYKSFISYSHFDQKWANWLHKKLESYHPDKRINGRFNNLKPIFKDIEELSATTDLPGKIKLSLDNSETLIVICSKSSRKSTWVNAEVKYFIETRGVSDVFLFVIEGEPFANGENEVIPGSILEYDEKLKNNILYCDARLSKRVALFKLISGMLNVGYDKIIERERIKRKKKNLIILILILMTVLIITYVTYFIKKSAMSRDSSIINEHIESAIKLSMESKYEDSLNKLDEVKSLIDDKYFYKWNIVRSSIINKALPFPAFSLRENNPAHGVLSICSNKNGSEVSFSYEDGTIRILNLLDFTYKTLKLSDKWIYNLTYMSDKELVAIDTQGKAFIVNDGKLSKSYDTELPDLNDLSSFENENAVLFGANNKVIEYSPKDNQLSTIHEHHKNKITSVKVFSKNYLATGDVSGKLIIYDLLKRKILREFNVGAKIVDIAVSLDNTIGVVATSDDLEIFPTQDESEYRKKMPIFDQFFRQNKLVIYPASDKLDNIENIEFTTDTDLFIGMKTGVIARVDIRNTNLEYYRTGNAINKILPLINKNFALLFSADNMGLKIYDLIFSSAFREGSLYSFADVNESPRKEIPVNSMPSKDGSVLAVYHNNQLDILDGTTYTNVYSKIFDSEIKGIIWSNDYNILIFTKNKLTNLELRNLSSTDIFKFNSEIDSIKYFSNSNKIYVFYTASRIDIFNNLDFSKKSSLDFKLNNAKSFPNVYDVSSDDKMIAYGYSDGRLDIYDIQSNKIIFSKKLREGNIFSLLFSPDSKSIAIGGDVGNNAALQILTFKDYHIENLLGDNAAIYKLSSGGSPLAFSNDSKILASVDTQGNIVVYDLNSINVIYRLEALEFAPGNSVSFSPDNGYFNVGYVTGLLRRIDIVSSFKIDSKKILNGINLNNYKRLSLKDKIDEFNNIHQYFQEYLLVEANVCNLSGDVSDDIFYVLWYLRSIDDAIRLNECKKYNINSSLSYLINNWINGRITYK